MAFYLLFEYFFGSPLKIDIVKGDHTEFEVVPQEMPKPKNKEETYKFDENQEIQETNSEETEDENHKIQEIEDDDFSRKSTIRTIQV